MRWRDEAPRDLPATAVILSVALAVGALAGAYALHVLSWGW